MKRKELEEFKKRWEENLGGLGEMLNSPWFAVSIKYDRETYDKILEALVECNEKVIDCVSELCEIDCKMNGTNIEDCL